MTNQNAIKILRKMETKLSEHLTGCMEADVEIVEELDAIDVAIDALEQEKTLDKGMNTFDCGEVCCECCSRDICIHMTADKDDTTTDTENLIIEAADRRYLTFAKNFNGRAYALMDVDWIGYFDTIGEILGFLGIK